PGGIIIPPGPHLTALRGSNSERELTHDSTRIGGTGVAPPSRRWGLLAVSALIVWQAIPRLFHPVQVSGAARGRAGSLWVCTRLIGCASHESRGGRIARRADGPPRGVRRHV